MSIAADRMFEALAGAWPAPLGDGDRSALAGVLADLPEELRAALVGATVDPERRAWARATLAAVRLVTARGATARGFATDEILECTDQRGEPFGLLPLAFGHPPHPAGRESDLVRLLGALDAAFARRRYALWIRRPLPEDLDVDPIRRAVVVWLGHSERLQSHAVYEEEGIALDLTVLDGGRIDAKAFAATDAEARVATVLPLVSLDRLVQLDDRLTDAASRAEESVGRLPLVVVAASDHRWCVSRGYLQQALYGTPTRVSTVHGDERQFEAEFVGTGRSMFSDPACRCVTRLALVDAAPGELLPREATSFENPWSPALPALRSLGPTFAARPGGAGTRVTLRWER